MCLVAAVAQRARQRQRAQVGSRGAGKVAQRMRQHCDGVLAGNAAALGLVAEIECGGLQFRPRQQGLQRFEFRPCRPVVTQHQMRGAGLQRAARVQQGVFGSGQRRPAAAPLSQGQQGGRGVAKTQVLKGVEFGHPGGEVHRRGRLFGRIGSRAHARPRGMRQPFRGWPKGHLLETGAVANLARMFTTSRSLETSMHRFATALAAAAGRAAAPAHAATNLIVNGDAESAIGADDGSVVAVPGWATVTGNFTAVTYDAGGWTWMPARQARWTAASIISPAARTTNMRWPRKQST